MNDNRGQTKKKSIFPKGFFSKERPEISLKESLKDVIPVEWEKKKKISKKGTLLN